MSKWVWVGILAAATAAESYALVRREQGQSGTATAHIRRTLGIDPPRPYAVATRPLVVAGCAWLAYHLAQPPLHSRDDQP